MRYLIVIVVAILFASCGSSRVVTRIDSKTTTELSGRWNDTDARSVANALTGEITAAGWIEEFTKSNEKKPVIVVGNIKNKSHEHIDKATFIKHIEKVLINSPKVRLVQGGAKRDDIRLERLGQADFASSETAKMWGEEIGADFILQGTLSSIVDQAGKNKVVFYKITFELANLETNELVWMGDHEIKKMIHN